MDPPILIPLSYVVSIGSSVVAALVAAIVYLSKTKDAAAVAAVAARESAAKEAAAARDAADKAASAALRESEKGRLDDMRAANAVMKETQERALPVLERVAIELRSINERAAARAARRAAEPDSDHPAPWRASEAPGWVADAMEAAKRAEDAAAEVRRLSDKGGLIPRGRTP